MPRLAFRHITGNEIVPNTRLVSISNDTKELLIRVVNYDIVAAGVRIKVENCDKEELYDYLTEHGVVFNVVNLGIFHSVIDLIDFNYTNHL